MSKENKALVRRILEDLGYEVQIAEGDRVVTCWSSIFTHTGDLIGVPATSTRVKQNSFMFDRIKSEEQYNEP
jgi:predicted ester cyclase